jgi:hypothetical protein
LPLLSKSECRPPIALSYSIDPRTDGVGGMGDRESDGSHGGYGCRSCGLAATQQGVEILQAVAEKMRPILHAGIGNIDAGRTKPMQLVKDDAGHELNRCAWDPSTWLLRPVVLNTVT